MKRLLFGIGCMVLGGLCLSAQAGTTYVVRSGETLSMGGAGSSKSGVTDLVNQRGNVVDLQAGATLYITNNGNNCWRNWAHIICTNGLAYVSRGTADTSGTWEIRRSLIVSGEGQLRVKGFTAVSYNIDASGSTFFGESVFDVDDFAFVNDDGTPRAGTLTMSGPGSLGRLPVVTTENKLTLKWTAGRAFVLLNGNQWANDDTFSPPSGDTAGAWFLGETGALKEGCQVTVGANQVFGIVPAVVSDSDPYLHVIDLDAGAHVFTNKVNVVLSDATSRFSVSNFVDVVNKGDITGVGSVVVGVQRTGTTPLVTSLLGSNSYTGETEISTANEHVIFGSSVPTGTLRNKGENSSFSFLGPNEEGAANVSVSKFEGSYYSGELRAAAGQKVTVREASGKLYAQPTGDGAQIDFNPAVGGAVVRYHGAAGVTCNGVSPEQAGVPLTDIGSEVLFTLPKADGTVDWGVKEPAVSAPWYAVAGTAVYANTPQGDYPLRAKAGAAVTVRTTRLGTDQVNALLETNATLAVEFGMAWTNDAVLWIDPNAETTALYMQGEMALPEWKENLGEPKLTKYFDANNTQPLVEGMTDCRPWQTTYMLRNARAYNYVISQPPKYDEAVSSVFAVLKSDGPNGLKYLDCAADGSSRRIPLGVGTISPNESGSMKATLLVMAFDASKGGGKAIVGTTESAFARTPGLANPIVNGAVNATIWINGQKIASPTTEKLANGWQIISIDLSKYTLNGFGWIHDYSDAGGANGPRYGEIVVFDQEVSTLDRQQVERYLAQKWGVATYAAEATDETYGLTISGKGAASVNDVPVKAGGSFRGTLTLNGSVLTLPAALPWSDADIPSEGRLLWFDPDDAAAFSLTTRDREPCVCALFQRGKTESSETEGATFLYATGSRRPYPRKWTRGFGVEHTWLDYEHSMSHTPGSSDGNVLRLKAWHPNENYYKVYDTTTAGTPGVDVTVSGRTYFLVTDSCRGGGDTLRGGVSSAGVFGSRGSYPARSKQIWNASDDRIKNGTTRLNGLAVASPTSTGFTGEPEVLSLCTKDSAVSFGALGNFSNTESTNNFTCAVHGFGEMFGELLVYDRELDEDQRKGIETYLLNKWIGRLPKGYTDWRGATIDGNGTVLAPTAAHLPKFAAGFTGDVRLTESADLAFTYRDGTIADALDFGGGSFAFAEASKVTVTVATRRRPGEYVLAEAGALTGKLPSLALSGEAANVGDSKLYALAVKDGKLVLTVSGVGMVLMIR